MSKLLQIDFNDVITDQGSAKNRLGKFVGKPREGAKETIENLIRSGYEVEVLTAFPQEDWKLITRWLEAHEFPVMLVSNIKKPALAYIDNRAVRFTNWADIAFYYL